MGVWKEVTGEQDWLTSRKNILSSGILCPPRQGASRSVPGHLETGWGRLAGRLRRGVLRQVERVGAGELKGFLARV